MINNSPSYNHTKPKEKNVCIKNDISRLLIYQKTFKRTNEPKKKKCTELQSSNNNNHGSIYMYIKSLNPPCVLLFKSKYFGCCFCCCVRYFLSHLSLTDCLHLNSIFHAFSISGISCSLSLSMFAAC